jgi:hypothetical protein
MFGCLDGLAFMIWMVFSKNISHWVFIRFGILFFDIGSIRLYAERQAGVGKTEGFFGKKCKMLVKNEKQSEKESENEGKNGKGRKYCSWRCFFILLFHVWHIIS